MCGTHNIYQLQLIVHLELEGQVAMVIAVDPSPLLHTHSNMATFESSMSESPQTDQKDRAEWKLYLVPTFPGYLEDDGADEGVDGGSVRERRALEVPEDDASLREDGEPVQHPLLLAVSLSLACCVPDLFR